MEGNKPRGELGDQLLYNFEESIKLESCKNENINGTVTVGKLYGAKILNQMAAEDMIHKSWQLESNNIIRDGGPNIFIIQIDSLESAMFILNSTP